MTPQDEALQLLTQALAALAKAPAVTPATVTVTATASLGWSPERFWSAPDPTQVDAADLAQALNLTRGAVYKLVRRSSLPCRKRLDGALAFTIGDVRIWLDQRQQVVNPVPMRLAPSTRKPR